MSLLQMSFSGGILILVILVLRGIFIHKLPKKTFLALWWVALLRLLLPVAVPSAFSVYSLFHAGISAFESGETSDGTGIWAYLLSGTQDAPGEEKLLSTDVQMKEAEPGQEPGSRFPLQNNPAGQADGNGVTSGRNKKTSQYKASAGLSETTFPINTVMYKKVIPILYLTGAFLLAAFFAISYLRCCREFRMSLPVREPFFETWLKDHPAKRCISIRCSDRITAPLTYGILRPVILLPGKSRPDDSAGSHFSGNPESCNIRSGASQGEAGDMDAAGLEYVLLHEYIHIRRLDAMTKLLIILGLCVHWFNPFVWAMYLLFNRDIEMACDEQVVRQLGMESRAPYALALIGMEEKKRLLMPLCNGFGRNAIEERIKSIMKIKKTSLCAIGMAVILVAGVTAAFATTATADNRQVSVMPGTDYTEAEYQMLLALKPDGYEEMTVSEYREEVFKITDTEGYMDLLNRLEQDERAEELKGENETAAFLYDCFFPLTAEKWEEREFDGSIEIKSQSTWDSALLEYNLFLMIQNKDTLKVGDYLAARTGIIAELEHWMETRSGEELREEATMQELLQAEIANLHDKWETDSLGFRLETYFLPFGGYDTETESDNAGRAAGNDAADPAGTYTVNGSRNTMEGNVLYGNGQAYAEEDAELQAWVLEERLAQYEEILAPYLSFGLTYAYDASADRVRLYYQGKEVRGLVDEEQGCWITESAGIDSYAEDAAELYAVYKEGVLVGLREATAEEQAEYTQSRRTNSKLKKQFAAELERELRGEPGRTEDYESLFTLKTSDYKELSVADFDMRLLEWTNDNFNRMERISMDMGWNDFQVPMDDEEFGFVKMTVFLSGIENGKYVQSDYTGQQAGDPVYDKLLPQRIASEEGAAWCNLYYQCSWHIEDMEGVTVGQRDTRVAAIMRSVEKFWNETDFEELVKMEKRDVVEVLQGIAEECGDDLITFSIRKDQVSFEKMDERGREFD